MKRKNLLGMFAFAVVAMLGLSVVSAYGFGVGRVDLTEDEIAEMDANREAMQNAVETGDYAAWEGLMMERLADMEDSINEEAFAEIQARHEERERLNKAVKEAQETGDWSEVEALREEFGFGYKGIGQGKHGGMGRGEGRGMGQGQGMMTGGCIAA